MSSQCHNGPMLCFIFIPKLSNICAVVLRERSRGAMNSDPCAIKVWDQARFNGNSADVQQLQATTNWENEQKYLLAAFTKANHGKSALLKVLHKREAPCPAASDADPDTPLWISRYPTPLLVTELCLPVRGKKTCALREHFCGHPTEVSDRHRSAFITVVKLVRELHEVRECHDGSAAIVHRDVDVANILVVEDEVGKMVWKLADFGGARISQNRLGLFEPTVPTGHYQTQDISLMVEYLDEVKSAPKALHDIISLAAVFHQFVSGGKHFLFNHSTGDQFERDARDYLALPLNERRTRLLKLPNMPGPSGRYSDAHDLFLYMADTRNQCSLLEAERHPFLMSARVVRTFLELVHETILDKQEEKMKALSELFELKRDSTVGNRKDDIINMICSFPHGLREQAGKSSDQYRKLLMWPEQPHAASRDGSFDYGWASSLDMHFFSYDARKGQLYKRYSTPREPFFFSVRDLLRTLHNLFKHAADIPWQGKDNALMVDNTKRDLPRLLREGQTPDDYLATMIRIKYPFLLSHVFHILQYYKDDKELISDALRELL